MTTETKTPAVYAAWAGVCEDMARGGIGKNRQADMGRGGKYQFRGIDDVFHALSASMVAHKLGVGVAFCDPVVTPRDKGEGRFERHVVCAAAFTLYSLADGSSVGPFRFVGEAADSGDKATNKAQSIAYKYFAIETFAIPTKGVLADEEPNEPESSEGRPVRQSQPKLDGFAITSGPAKGKRFSEATAVELAAYGNEVVAVLNDHAKSAHHAKAQAICDAIDAEFATRDKHRGQF